MMNLLSGVLYIGMDKIQCGALHIYSNELIRPYQLRGKREEYNV